MSDAITHYGTSVPHNKEMAVLPSPPLFGKYVNKIDNFYWISMAKAVFGEKKTIVTSFGMWFGVGWRRSVRPVV